MIKVIDTTEAVQVRIFACLTLAFSAIGFVAFPEKPPSHAGFFMRMYATPIRKLQPVSSRAQPDIPWSATERSG